MPLSPQQVLDKFDIESNSIVQNYVQRIDAQLVAEAIKFQSNNVWQRQILFTFPSSEKIPIIDVIERLYRDKGWDTHIFWGNQREPEHTLRLSLKEDRDKRKFG